MLDFFLLRCCCCCLALGLLFAFWLLLFDCDVVAVSEAVDATAVDELDLI